MTIRIEHFTILLILTIMLAGCNSCAQKNVQPSEQAETPQNETPIVKIAPSENPIQQQEVADDTQQQKQSPLIHRHPDDSTILFRLLPFALPVISSDLNDRVNAEIKKD